jgi:hypothetical protein
LFRQRRRRKKVLLNRRLIYDRVVDDTVAAMIDIGEPGVNNYETFTNIAGTNIVKFAL